MYYEVPLFFSFDHFFRGYDRNFPFVFGRIEDTRISFWNFLTFKDQDGKTALHLAATNGHSDTVSALIMNGADISSQDFVSLFIFSFFKLQFFHIFLPTDFLGYLGELDWLRERFYWYFVRKFKYYLGYF